MDEIPESYAGESCPHPCDEVARLWMIIPGSAWPLTDFCRRWTAAVFHLSTRREQTATIHRLLQMTQIILASASAIRAALLGNAGLRLTTAVARVDEESLRQAMTAEGASPRDQADALAELKAARIAGRNPEAVVIGCDQVLDLDGQVLGKPETIDAARAQLTRLRGRSHKLHSAVVLYEGNRPVWRHVEEVRLTMRAFSDDYLDDYLQRNGAGLLDSVGGYKLEEEGVRLFSEVRGDYFTVLGLPLLPLLNYLAQRGMIAA